MMGELKTRMEIPFPVFAESMEEEQKARQLAQRLGCEYAGLLADFPESMTGEMEGLASAALVAGKAGLWLEGQASRMKGERVRIRGDFLSLLPRIRTASLRSELLIRASGINKMMGTKDSSPPAAFDATAGMGEDSFLLAAAGFTVLMCEKDPVIAALLQDTLDRAMADDRLRTIASRMTLIEGDSISVMKSLRGMTVILLDPMFPMRTKSALVKKKFQLIHLLEKPCEDEVRLLQAAMQADPGRILIKRPAKGPCLADQKPSFSLTGKAIRYDCLLRPYAMSGDGLLE